MDPGSAVTGYGVVDGDGRNFNRIASGTIRTRPRDGGALRLRTIYERLTSLLDEHLPDAVSLERSFVAENVQSAFRLGEARAMVLLAAAQRDLALFEYNPTDVKLTVAGYGRADKEQVKFMVRRAFNLADSLELASDAADALALALCHLTIARNPAALSANAGRSARRWRISARGTP
ncbi:MAG TPA: crossover junction endodeoxyribonuclease RuvC [Candidatus Binataceae bacterium]|nr:crossover junction endodeoxyribonuclease RuvC [Candidatus Binataceae bacterium]